MPRRLAPSAVLLSALALAAPAHAGILMYGSDLSQPANLEDHHPRDWAAWPTAVAAGGELTVPAQGEVAVVQLKGMLPKSPNDARYQGRYPDFEFHIVTLRPPDNRLLQATGDLPVPRGGDPDQITTVPLHDQGARMCVLPGDRVAIATSGGFGNHTTQFGGFPDDYYAEGYPVQMFSRVPSSSYSVFKQPPGDDTFQLGDPAPGAEQPGRELLMRVTIGTGADAGYSCRSKEEQSTPSGNPPTSVKALVTTAAKSVVKVRRKAVRIGLSCPAGALPCNGALKLSNRSAVYGTQAFALAPGTSARVAVRLGAAGRKVVRRLKRKRKLTVKATATTEAGSTSQRFYIRR